MRILTIILLLCAGPVWAGDGGTRDFERRSAEARKAAQGKVAYEKLDPQWSKDGKTLTYKRAEGGWWKVSLADGKKAQVPDRAPGAKAGEELKAKKSAKKGPSGPVSPDKKWKVRFEGARLHLWDGERDTEEVVHVLPDGWEFDNGVTWSPNGKHFAVWKREIRPPRLVTYVASSPKDRVQPTTSTNRYPKPGDDLSVERPLVFTLGGEEPLEVDEELAPNAFDFRRHGWRVDGERFAFEYIERGFGKFRLLEIDAAKRAQRVVVREDSETFVYVFGKCFRHDLDDGKQVLWLSERDGWNHLYLMDGREEKARKQLTKGEWIVRKVVRVDEEKGEVWMQVGGYYPDQDPYHVHWARLDLASGKLTMLTEGDGTHELRFSPDRSHYVARWSRVDHPPVHELRRTVDGSLVTVLEKANAKELLESGWRMPQRFVAKCRDGKFDIHGVIWRPRDFDPKKRYPVVEHIYAGPHDSFVPQRWATWHGVRSEMAEHGFIVVQIDGRGTSNRSREFHRLCYKNLKDAGLPDRIAWMKAAAEEVPQMDLTRVGIYGGSAGGQSALGALLFHGDFYQAAAADCGCHDNRMDKIWWNEQWMDWPVGPHYAENSNVTHAGKLKGDLLLTVGELDKNVDPASTMQVVNALIKADKDFDLVVVPGAGHGVGERPYLRRKRVEFFQRALGGPVPLD